MRKPFVAGNWKMNKTVEQAKQLISELLPELQKVPSVERVLCPPFTSLASVATLLAGSGIGLGAQNLHWEAGGAFTGEVAPAMVKEFCQYVIIGHSERRSFFGETDATVNKRVKAALAIGLIPIMCVGETLGEYEANKTNEVVTRQMIAGLDGIPEEQAGVLVIAYEPVWAIGTGKAASGEGANRVVGDVIRVALTALFGKTIAQGTRSLYGGSVTSANAEEFFGQTEIDGALVGGGSLKPVEFLRIVQAAAK